MDELTIATASDLIRTGKISPVDLISGSLERIQKLNSKLNIYVTVTSERALDEAKRAERLIQAGDYIGPLHGIPVSLKDIVYTKGIPTTCGEKKLEGYVPDYNATVVTRFKEAGAIIVGKAHPLYGEFFPNPEYGFCRNPWDTERLAGYSSDGPAVAVAVGTDLGSIGSDGGGSIRYPAACCGVVGLKPTFGRVSRYGAIVFGVPNDYLGPLTRTVQDASIVLQTIAGHDERDPYTSEMPVPDYNDLLNKPVTDMVIGLPKEHFWDYLDDEVRKLVEEAVLLLESIGCKIQEISLPTVAQVGSEYAADQVGDQAKNKGLHTLLSETETSAFYEQQLADWPRGYPDILMDRIRSGKKTLATDYIRAVEVRRRLTREIDAAFNDVDVILTPASILPAPMIGQWEFELGGRTWGIGDLASRMARPFNMSGHPAISVPCGFTDVGLPVAFQMVAPKFGEPVLFRVSHAYQGVTYWHTKRPMF